MTDVAKLVAELTLDEKAALTAGVDMWSTAPVPGLGIPSIQLTDGPNGARGTQPGPAGPTATCVPCGSALGATWDPDLVERVGALVGREARTKGARVLLAPTVNIHRSPLAGRNFECYSTVRIELDDRAFAYWDPGQPDCDVIAARSTALPMGRSSPVRPRGWQVDPGRYELHVGRSSAAIDHVLALEITE